MRHRGRRMLGICISAAVICGALLFCTVKLYDEEQALYQDKIEKVRSLAEKEKRWIAENQGSEGQIYLNYTDDGAGDVNPYFACLAAQGLLSGEATDEELEQAFAYICWHREHFLEEQGEISNYRLIGGQLLTQGDKDSVDSYVAVFLSLLCRFGEAGGDLTEADPDGEALCLGIHKLEELWDGGLTKVSPDNGIRYLMDNVEVLGALNDMKNYLDTDRGHWLSEGRSQECMEMLERMIKEGRETTERLLWNDKESRYEIGLDDAGRIFKFESWEQLYPDAVAQIYGAAFLKDMAGNKRGRDLYGMFNRVYDWERMELPEEEAFGWAVLSYIAVEMEDADRAETYLHEYESSTKKERAYPLHTAEAGWTARTCAGLEKVYEKALNRSILEVAVDWIKEQVS